MRSDPKQPTVLLGVGTRPEAIKMAPLVRRLKRNGRWNVIVCASGQHQALLDESLRYFDIQSDLNLNVMRENQPLSELSARCISGFGEVCRERRPDLVIVQGDTTSTVSAAQAAFSEKIPVAHLEAGLRTPSKYSPFPEEMNRRLVTQIADFHFAPTTVARDNLYREGVNRDSIFLTGNTGIDALKWMKEKVARDAFPIDLPRGKKLILLTVHRRENFGEPLARIFSAIDTFAARHGDVHFVYPVHPNPNVKDLATARFGGRSNFSLIPPLAYPQLVQVLDRAHFVLSDSGGLQEEAPALGKPVLVLRETTERMEAIDGGAALLLGSDTSKIVSAMESLLDKESAPYRRMSQARDLFGDGTASEQIATVLEKKFCPLGS